MRLVQHLYDAHHVPISRGCQVLGLPRSSYYRAQQPSTTGPPRPRPSPPRKLSTRERDEVLEVLDSPRFVDKSPYQAYADLLDEGSYLCSVSTMYRLLGERGELRERRNQLSHPAYATPRLHADGPNQVWSWDITKLPGPQKWTSYYLYVVLDLFSRYVVGFLVAERETSQLAHRLLSQAYRRQGIETGQLVLHADRGAQMTSKTVSQLLVDLGVVQSHSRPRVSNDNAFSEAQFKTVKYRPEFPGYFASQEDARQWSRMTMEWYNHEHHHQNLGWMTPFEVHYGLTQTVLATRQQALDTAFLKNPERFVRGAPTAPGPPENVFLNKLPNGGDPH